MEDHSEVEHKHYRAIQIGVFACNTDGAKECKSGASGVGLYVLVCSRHPQREQIIIPVSDVDRSKRLL